MVDSLLDRYVTPSLPLYSLPLSVPPYLQAQNFLEIIIIADISMPFEGTWRQQFLMALASVLNSIPIVVNVQTLSRDEVEARGLPLEDGVM